MRRVNVVMAALAVFPLLGCVGDQVPTPEEVLHDFAAGPGQPDPEIVGGRGAQVFYLQPPAELAVNDWVPVVHAHLYGRDLQRGQRDLLVPLLDTRVRFNVRSDGDVLAWHDGHAVEVLNTVTLQRSTLLQAGNAERVADIDLLGLTVFVNLRGTDGDALVAHDLTTGVETVLFEAADIQAFDVASQRAMVATSDAIVDIDRSTLEVTTVVDRIFLATGPFIDGDYVVYSGADLLADGVGITRLQARATHRVTGATRVLATLHEGVVGFILDVIAGDVDAPLWLRGATGGYAVITESEYRDFGLREHVRLFDLATGTARQIGDFNIPVNRFWDGAVASQVKVFDGHVLWFNPEGQRVVSYDVATERKQKFAP